MPQRVSILAHEGGGLPLEETLVDMLTQLFLRLNAHLETQILVDNVAYFDEKTKRYHKKLMLVDQAWYKKIQVESTEYIKDVDADLIVMLCHGLTRNPAKELPASLRFGCALSEAGRGHTGLKVFAKATNRILRSEHTFLHDVICHSKIAIILACYGNEVVRTTWNP